MKDLTLHENNLRKLHAKEFALHGNLREAWKNEAGSQANYPDAVVNDLVQANKDIAYLRMTIWAERARADRRRRLGIVLTVTTIVAIIALYVLLNTFVSLPL